MTGRAMGSWPAQGPDLGLTHQCHSSRKATQQETVRCERWYAERSCIWVVYVMPRERPRPTSREPPSGPAVRAK